MAAAAAVAQRMLKGKKGGPDPDALTATQKLAALLIVLAQLGSLILSQPPFNVSLWGYIGLNTLPGGLYSSVANAFIADILPAVRLKKLFFL